MLDFCWLLECLFIKSYHPYVSEFIEWIRHEIHRRSTCSTGFTTSSINNEEDELPDLRSATGSGSPAAGGHCGHWDTLQIQNNSAGYYLSSYNFWHIHIYIYIIYTQYIYTIYILYTHTRNCICKLYVYIYIFSQGIYPHPIINHHLHLYSSVTAKIPWKTRFKLHGIFGDRASSDILPTRLFHLPRPCGFDFGVRPGNNLKTDIRNPWWENHHIPSGKHTKSYRKSPFLMGKSTISITIFNSELLNYQRVYFSILGVSNSEMSALILPALVGHDLQNVIRSIHA